MVTGNSGRPGELKFIGFIGLARAKERFKANVK